MKDNNQEKYEDIRWHKHNRFPLGAVIIIIIGFLFLLNNFGIVPYSIWGILWRFWPLLIILIGLRFLFGRTTASRIIVGIIAIIFLLYALAFSLAITTPAFHSWMMMYTPWFNTTMPMQYQPYYMRY